MPGKTFFVDLSRCTACRGCQVACKQWKQLPAEQTKNTGSHQNPPDLSFVTLKVVRMKEVGDASDFKWLFLPDQCRHCVDPPCKDAGDGVIKDAITQDKTTGAVLFTEKTKGLPFDVVKGACPYDIPRQDPKTKVISKCDMCNDRVTAGFLPACVKTCPTGAMNFGERDEMLAMGKKRLEELKKTKPKAVLVDYEQVRVVFLTEHAPNLYHKTLMSDADGPDTFTRFAALDKLLNPLRQARG
ncbi:MAG: formate dehydrogenase [Desulfovibrio sp.]|nr:formate dehydrogenase [Desulfovibrio sp.]MBI4958064.1 formate dehydrogenase [Desulfovibrio sp.]